MGSVIGDILPLALGVAISPMPIIAVILMLLSARAGAASTGFLVGWIAGIILAATVFTVLAQTAGLSTSGGGSTAGAVVKLVLGVLLLLLAVRQWKGRHTSDEPKWLSALDSVTAAKATGLGFLLAAVNPKNLLMIIGAGVAIGQAKLPVDEIVVVLAIFTVIAGATVAAPVIVYRFAKDRATVWLGEMKTWLVANNATVMVVLLAVLGFIFIGKGIGSF